LNDSNGGDDYPYHIDKGRGVRAIVNGVDDEKNSSRQIEELKQKGTRFYFLVAVEPVSGDYFYGTNPPDAVDQKFHSRR
jgi:hypothetical protein